MSDKKSIININFEPLAAIIMSVLVGVAIGVFFLVRGLSGESLAAYAIAGGLAVIILAGLGSLATLGILWIGNRFARSREAQEQVRFTENTKENMGILQAVIKGQGTQNTMLLRQARDTTKMLPSGNGADILDDDSYLEIDADIFSELDG